jgi:hypothetical protein
MLTSLLAYSTLNWGGENDVPAAPAVRYNTPLWYRQGKNADSAEEIYERQTHGNLERKAEAVFANQTPGRTNLGGRAGGGRRRRVRRHIDDLAAIRGGVNSLMAEILEDHIRLHITHPNRRVESPEEPTEDLISLVRAYLK